MQSIPFQPSSPSASLRSTKTAEKPEQMHLVETSIDESAMDESGMDEQAMDEPTMDDSDLHGSKMEKAEEFTILPGIGG